MPSTATLHRLQVSARHTFWGGDDETFELGVLCPEKQSAMPLEECLRCEKNGGLRLDPETRTLVAMCTTESEGTDLPEVYLPYLPPERVPTASRASVASIMATNVICVGPELPLTALEELFLERNISGAPVVNEHGVALGIVSKTDLVRYRGTRSPHGDRDSGVVADIMTPLAFCIPSGVSIAKAAALMAFEGMHRLPVVNANRQVVGLVSSLDVMRWLAESQGYVLGGASRKPERAQ